MQIRNLHLHAESEGTAMTFSFRVHIYVTFAMVDYLLDNGETKADALVIHRSGPKKFSELRE